MKIEGSAGRGGLRVDVLGCNFVGGDREFASLNSYWPVSQTESGLFSRIISLP